MVKAFGNDAAAGQIGGFCSWHLRSEQFQHHTAEEILYKREKQNRFQVAAHVLRLSLMGWPGPGSRADVA